MMAVGAADYSRAIDGLSLSQAKLLLSLQNVDAEQQRHLLLEAGLISSSDKMTAKHVAQALSVSSLDTAEKNRILTKAGLMNAETGELLVSESCTEAKLREALATTTLDAEDKERIITAILGTSTNGSYAISFDVLTGAIWKNIKALAKWMVTNPVGQIGLTIAAIGLLRKGYDSIITSKERLADTKLEGLDEEISSLDAEIQSLETLQGKLKDAKGDKAELAQIQNELNDAIGDTPGLLNGEGKAYDVANAKLKAYIESKKQERDAAKQNKIDASKEKFDNNAYEADGWFGFDATADQMREWAKMYQGFVDYFNNLPDDSEIRDKFKDADEYAQSAFKMTKGDIDMQGWTAYWDEQVQVAYDAFDAVIEDYEGYGGQDFLKNMISNMVRSGADFTEISNAIQAVMDNEQMQEAINTYWESLVNPDIDSEKALENVKKAFDEIIKLYPGLEGFFDGVYERIISGGNKVADSTEENLNKMTVSLSKTADKIKELYSFVKEIDDDGLSPDSIEKIISEYPELIGYIGDEVRLRTELKKKITEEETKYKQALRSKVMASSSFAELVESKNQELFKELGLAYNKDTQKFELESRRKAAIAIKDATTAANAWAQIYADEQVLSAPDFTTELHASGKNSKYKTQSGDWKFEVFNDGKLKTYTYEAGSSMAKILDSQRELSNISNFDIDFGNDDSSKRSYEDLYDEFLKTLEQEVENLDDSISRINTKLEHAIKTGDAEQIQILSQELDNAYAQKKELLESKANEARTQLALIMEEIYAIAPQLRGKGINEITPYEIEAISMSLGDASDKWDSITKSAQNYYETISEWSDEWWANEEDKLNSTEEYYNTLLDDIDRYTDRIEKSRQEEIDTLDKQITKEEALLKIKQGEYDITNKLKEAQKDIDKEIANSRNSKQYLSEFEYDKIFGDADYEFLSGEIENITNDIAGISANFYKQIEDAYANDQLYLVEAITAEYERQLASKERELEIAKAKVDLEKKRLTLENAKNERNIKQYSENGITWVADQEKVKQATEDFIDAQATIKDLQEKSAQQMELDRRQANIDMLNSQKESIEYQNELMNKAVENLKLAIEDVTDPLADLGSVLQTLVNDFNEDIRNAARDVEEELETDGDGARVRETNGGYRGGGGGGKGYNPSDPLGLDNDGMGLSVDNIWTLIDNNLASDSNAVATIPGFGNVGVNIGSDGKTTTTGLPDGTIIHTGDGHGYKITGGDGAGSGGDGYTSEKLYDSGGFASGKGLMLKGVNEEETVLPPWLTKEILTPEYNENFSKLLENMQMVSHLNPLDSIVKPKTDSLLMKNINQPTSIAKTWTGNMYVEGGDPNEVLKAIDQAFDRITI